MTFAAALADGQKRPLTVADYDGFETPGAAAISPDGRWLAYAMTRTDEHAELRLRPLTRDTTIAIAMAGAPVFAASSRWLLWTQSVTPAEREKLEKDKKPVRTSTGLLNLATLERHHLGESTAHRFSGNGRFVAWRRIPSDAARRDAADLIVRELETGITRTFGNVNSWVWADTGSQLAMAIETDGNTGNGVQLFDGASGRLIALASSSSKYRGLAWRRRSDDLVVLATRVSPAFRDTTHEVLSWRSPGTGTATSSRLNPDSSRLAPGIRITESRQPEWSLDGSFIVIGLRPRTPALRDSAAADAAPRSDVQVWHARDVRPIPQQKAQDQADLRRSLVAIWRPSDGRIITVGADLMESSTVGLQARFGLEVVASPYPFGTMFGRPQRDVDVVDLSTGERRRVVTGARFGVTPSPSGRLLAHFSNGQWLVTEAATGRQRVIAAAGAVFADQEDDHPVVERGPYGPPAWTADERALLVHDRHDVWQLATDGRSALRLTSGGRDSVVHRLLRLDTEPGIDLSKPQYLSLSGAWSKQSGFARLEPGGRVTRLIISDHQYGRLMRADSAPAMAFLRQRFDTPPQWLAGRDPSAADVVSRGNSRFGDYEWGKAELVEFRSDSGQRLQGVLYYPAGYVQGRRYPMIVNTYEIMSTSIHSFVAPSERSYYNRSVWTSRGYFVFTPDVVFRPGDPGRSYLECVIPAVKSVLARGDVDSARVGLVGHSWGGYEAAYAPTQTDLFATSVAGAPITNFLSFAGAFHWTPGLPEFDHWETGQARMVKPPWEDPEGHLRNSPAAHIDRLRRPMLMMFGDADGTVDWHQGVEFYNFARRAGKEDFVMLVYPGEDHGLRRKENQIDYHRRILEWFGHYLKGEPAPEWMRRGVTWQERKVIQEGAR